MISRQYQRPLTQVVLYVGNETMRMKSALSMLAKGGTEQLSEIAQRVARRNGEARARGLREVSEKMKVDLESMEALYIDFQKNAFLRDTWEKVMAEGLAKGEAKGEAKGKAEGKAEGEAAGMLKVLRGMLQMKFGRIPNWAEERLRNANTAQIGRWSKRFVRAESLEDVVGGK